MCLYTASATPVLPTGYTTRQGLASSSSRMHDSCSCHIYTRLQRSIFLLPSQGHAAEHTVFMVQHIRQITGQVQHPATPQLTWHQLGAVWWTGNLVIPWLWEVTYHTTTHTSTYNSAWEQDQITTPTAGPDTSRYQAGLQMTCHPPKREGSK